MDSLPEEISALRRKIDDKQRDIAGVRHDLEHLTYLLQELQNQLENRHSSRELVSQE